MKKISVLHLSQVSGGGVERYIKLFLKFSNLEKFQHIIISPSPENYSSYEKYINRFYEINIEQSFSLIKLFKNVIKIRKIIKQENPDILYLHSSFAGVIGRLAAFKCGNCKVIYNPHGWSFNMKISKLKVFFYELIEYALSYLTDKIILISNSEFLSAKAIHINELKLDVIYNGIDISSEENMKYNNLEKISDKYIIGMVGRICDQKDPFFFVEFANLILKKEPNSFFIIVGDGELKSAIQEKILEYGLSKNFLITGWVESPEKYIQQFNQAVLFSKWEGFGLAVAEYMLYKKPIIISDIDGMAELIDDSFTGLKIKSGDLDEAVKKSFSLRENTILARKLGENAYLKVKTSFSAKTQIKLVENLLIKCYGV